MWTALTGAARIGADGSPRSHNDFRLSACFDYMSLRPKGTIVVSPTFSSVEPMVPTDADRKLAAASLGLLTQQVAGVKQAMRLQVVDEGSIPHRKVGMHRRILFKDLIAYRAENRRARSVALDELTRLSQELGLY